MTERDVRRSALHTSLIATVLTLRPRCGLSGVPASEKPSWLAACPVAALRQPRLLGGALVRGLASYVAAEGEDAERCLQQACVDAAEYGRLSTGLGLSTAAAVEAFCLCRAPILEATQRWAAETMGGGHQTADVLTRVSQFFDATLLSMVAALETASKPPGRGGGPQLPTP
ncbi:MAG: hypothetical protein IT306_28915 [Chloroflexi bacterium]|nr:hypothetical protein [Chloroflexota bacterium]